jgi:hypothetical protein
MHKAGICNRGWWNLLPHPPYNPDLAPSNLHLVGRLKDELRGNRFEVEDELKNGSGISGKLKAIGL